MAHVTEDDFVLHQRTIVPAVVAALMLLFAAAAGPHEFELPSQFFDLLRLVVSSAACYVVWDSACLRRTRLGDFLLRRSALQKAYQSELTEAEFAKEDQQAFEERLSEVVEAEEVEDVDDDEVGFELTPERIEEERRAWLLTRPARLQQWRKSEPESRASALAESLSADLSFPGEWAWTWAMISVAMLFNPLVPLRLHKESWAVLDLFAGAAFGLWALLARSARDAATKQLRAEAASLRAVAVQRVDH
jgi:hypothetical protein